jgi:large subunit ribosomal protein L29
MSVQDLREMTVEELTGALAEAKEEKFNLRFQLATNQLDNTARIKEVKREIAQILTVIGELEADSARSEAAEAGKESA